MDILDIHQVMELLPHRYPFLLIDRVLECKQGESMIAVKNVTYNEPFFQGHFPGRPIMPGVLILEAMAQVTGLLVFYSENMRPERNAIYYLVGVDKARFRKPVKPGDQLILTAKVIREIRGIYTFGATAEVEGRQVASASFMTTKAVVDH